MKKFVSFSIILILIISMVTFPIRVQANDYPDIDIHDNSVVESNSIVVTEDNIQRIINDYDVPQEVADSLFMRIDDRRTGDVVTLHMPFAQDETVSTGSQATTSNWSPIRIYDGHQLTDWVVTIRNGYSMTPITSQANANNILSFVGSVAGYTGSVFLDCIYPFGGALITAAQFILGLETNYVAPSSGDKLEAAPQYICFDTFTYVVVGGERYLGCRTYSSYVEQITWYAYYAAEHKQNTKVTILTKFFESANYDDRNATAVSWYALGGWIDDTVYIKIGDCQFMLY